MRPNNVPQNDENGTSNKWRDVLASLQVQMCDGSDYRAYLADSYAAFDRTGDSGGATLNVAVRNGFVREWVRSRLAGRLRRTVAQVYGDDVEVQLTTFDAPFDDGLRGSGLDGGYWSWSDTDRARHQRGVARDLDRRYPLRRNMTFDAFVASASNQGAHDACRSIVERPGDHYNPLTIVADTGLGKSHLCHATAHALRQRGFAVIILAAERFMNEYVAATREARVSELSERYRAADALVIDGIEKLISRTGTQTFLLNLLEHHLSENHQVVVAANAGYPIHDLDPELVSRLAGGLEQRIAPPDDALKRQVLEQYAAKRNLRLMPDAIAGLAQVFVNDLRELVGGIHRIAMSVRPAPDARAGEPVAVSRRAALDAARNRLTAPAPSLATPDRVLAAVSEAFAVAEHALTQPGRANAAITAARDALAYLLRERCGMTSEAVGDLLGRRSHSTILDATRRHEQRRDDDAALMQTEQEARRLIDSRRRRRGPSKDTATRRGN